jgi:hypothetical protein
MKIEKEINLHIKIDREINLHIKPLHYEINLHIKQLHYISGTPISTSSRFSTYKEKYRDKSTC